MSVTRIQISVVIPSFNSSDFIEDALESVRRQSLSPFETIIIDDGSEDDTTTVVNKYLSLYKDFNAKLIRQENKKVAAARNAGIKEAKGEWIAFLDADDIWYENKLQKVAEALLDNNHIDLVCHDEIISLNGRKIRENIYGPFDNFSEILFKSCCLSTSAICAIKKKIQEVGGFRENLEYYGTEDFDLWVRLAKASKFFYLHEFLGECRDTPGSITKDIALHTTNYWHVVRDHYYDLPTNLQNKFHYNYKKRCSEIFCGAGRRFLADGDFSSARKWSLKGISFFPLFLKGWIGFIFAVLKVKI